MLEKERESSDVLPAASSQHVKPRAGVVEKPRSIQQMSVCRTRERETFTGGPHSFQQKVGAAVRLAGAALGRRRVLADECAIDHRAAVQEETERNETREVLPRTTTTLVVLKASAYHSQSGQVPETETEQPSNNDCIRRMAGLPHVCFHCCLIQCSVLRDTQTRC